MTQAQADQLTTDCPIRQRDTHPDPHRVRTQAHRRDKGELASGTTVESAAYLDQCDLDEREGK
jgi:hypothetical protein